MSPEHQKRFDTIFQAYDADVERARLEFVAKQERIRLKRNFYDRMVGSEVRDPMVEVYRLLQARNYAVDVRYHVDPNPEEPEDGLTIANTYLRFQPPGRDFNQQPYPVTNVAVTLRINSASTITIHHDGMVQARTEVKPEAITAESMTALLIEVVEEALQRAAAYALTGRPGWVRQDDQNTPHDEQVSETPAAKAQESEQTESPPGRPSWERLVRTP